MAHRSQAPYRPQDPTQVEHLVQALEAHKGKKSGKGGFSCRKHTFAVDGSDHTVDSWKMQEHDYKKGNLPTYARGLFTYTNSKGQQQIAIRGYDKFFNHGEVRKTEWSNVQEHSRGPYELSVKENGCIIFMSGLDDGTLLVCSKHSTGAREDTDVSHAVVGEEWVDRHLQTVGKTRQDLARQLHQLNATAVAELCDDEFEEHVLAYNPETAGLYLHGLNLNLPEFVTYPAHLVDRFAVEWGFKKTMHIIENDLSKVRKFLDDVAETGNYAGRDTEGFVIRCQARETADSPYEDWFFKYKFEEPYLMYRQWRECTKAVIGGREPHYKKHKKITEQYITYARRRLHGNAELSKAYNQNHGIIKMRDDFLAERGLKGSDIIRQELQGGETSEEAITDNLVLAPVATIGCGKTTVAVALTKLYNWGHLQNDNIEGKGRPQKFASGICRGLVQHPVMIADRNNHQKRERKQLIEDVSKVVPQAQFVALQYVHDRANFDLIRQKTRERVLTRGDNHQTIQAGSKGQGEIIGIMEGFLNRFEPVGPESEPDDAFAEVINLDATATSRENLELIVSKLHSRYPKIIGSLPSGADLDRAIEAALNDYKPDIKHEVKSSYSNKGPRDAKEQQHQQQHQYGISNNQGNKPKQTKIEYFSLGLPAQSITTILDTIFRDQDPHTAHTYRTLQSQRRIQTEFHVTLIHKASASASPSNQAYWDQLTGLHFHAAQNSNDSPPELGQCRVLLERIVWDNRLMCFVVRLVPVEGSRAEWKSVNDVAHVTVGTVDKNVKPKESNDLLARWMKEGSGVQNGIGELIVGDGVELVGSVRAVMSR